MGAKFSNNGSSTISSSITAATMTITLAPGGGAKFPALAAGDWCMATLVKLVSGQPVHEIVRVTAITLDALTVVRGQEGTTATTFSAGDRIENRVTAGSLATKMDTGGGVFTGEVDHSDQVVKQAMLKDCAIAFFDSAAVNTIDYRNGSHQRWAPGTGAQTLAISNWPPSGAHGELLIEGVNLGAATITWPAINWLKADGTFTTTFSANGVTLNSAGIDFVFLWTRNNGATIYGKVLR